MRLGRRVAGLAGWSACLLAAAGAVPGHARAEVPARIAGAAASPAGGQTARGFGFAFDGLTGGRIELAAFRGRAVLIVNTASRCGYTGQYQGLQALWQSYRARGLTVVGVPSNDFGNQEPGTAAQIATFCELNFGVTFPMAARTAVTGQAAHPFYRWAAATAGRAAVPRWNFHKILLAPDGRIVATFPSAVAPSDPALRRAIEAALPPPRPPAPPRVR